MSVTLRDGSRVTIRPVEPDDRDALAEGFERLSPESRYRRFFAPMSRLRQRDLDYLTRLDHHDHEALLAVDETTGDGVGVARYVRTEGETAEPAIVVADDWQGRGLGSRLLGELTDRARAAGVKRFVAPVLAGNEEAIRTLSRLGDTTIRHVNHEVELHIELPPAEAAPPGFPSLLRSFASGAVEPARTLWDLLRPRRRTPPGTPRRNVIVVGTDGSEHAGAAVRAAAELAAATDAAIGVVGAHRYLPSDETALTEAVREAARDLRGRGLHVHEHLRRGDPALVLADVADEERARLIVVGAGERGKTSRRLIGGVADVVAEHAPCDVLIVRPPAA